MKVGKRMMVEAKYFRDYKHNYLILKCNEMESEGDSYQFKMLAFNKVEGLLNCFIRNVNGESYLYYDISSKVTLENLYQGKIMSYEQVKDFFYQMDRIYRNLGGFFIQEAGLLTQPDYIYYDFSSKKYFGLYYPARQEREENGYEQLMDFLISRVDTKNQQLTELVYQIYEMSEERYFSMADALALFEDKEEIAEQTCRIHKESLPEMESAGEDVIRQSPDSESAWDDVSGCDMEDERNRPSANTQTDLPAAGVEAERHKMSVFYSIFAVVSLCGLGVVCWIYSQFQLTQREQMILLCCGAVIALCLLFSVIQCILSGRRRGRTDKEEQLLQWDIEDEFREERAMVLQGGMRQNERAAMQQRQGQISRWDEETAVLQSKGQIAWRDERAAMLYKSGNVAAAGNDFARQDGETVFVDVQKQNREYKLYALDKKNKKHIELTKFPFTIGKMAGCVDCFLQDDSISRLHARIERQDGKIFLTDMNSKNGTYKNGLRMNPSETVEIEPGDEIRFGKLNYCYR